MNLQIVKEIIYKNHLLERYHISKIGIFGSIARGGNANDIDILIENFSNYEELVKFKEELERISQTKVDIVLEKYANPIVLHRAKKEIIYVS